MNKKSYYAIFAIDVIVCLLCVAYMITFKLVLEPYAKTYFVFIFTYLQGRIVRPLFYLAVSAIIAELILGKRNIWWKKEIARTVRALMLVIIFCYFLIAILSYIGMENAFLAKYGMFLLEYPCVFCIPGAILGASFVLEYKMI